MLGRDLERGEQSQWRSVDCSKRFSTMRLAVRTRCSAPSKVLINSSVLAVSSTTRTVLDCCATRFINGVDSRAPLALSGEATGSDHPEQPEGTKPAVDRPLSSDGLGKIPPYSGQSSAVFSVRLLIVSLADSPSLISALLRLPYIYQYSI